MSHILVTGGAGFIGSHLVDSLLADGVAVTVLDNFDSFYDRRIKERNIKDHTRNPLWHLIETDLRDLAALRDQLRGDFDAIVHLAAKAGVRPSIADPTAYQDTNVRGTQNLLEIARDRGIQQFVFASSSSVYRSQPARAVERRRSRPAAYQSVRQHQSERRAPRARIQPPLRHTIRRPALFHSVWTATAS